MGEAASKLYTSAEYEELVLAVETARRERRKADALFVVIKAVQQADSSVERLVANLLSVSSQLLKCKHVTLFFVDEARNLLVAANALDADGHNVELNVPMGHGVVGLVAATGNMIKVDQTARDSRFDKSTDLQTGFSTHSILCAPVVNRGKTVAVIEALNKLGGDDDDDAGDSSFDAEDEFIMQTITEELQAPLRKAALEIAFTGAIERATSEANPELSILLMYTQHASRSSLKHSASLAASVTPPLSPKKRQDDKAQQDGHFFTWQWEATKAGDAEILEAVVAMFRRQNTLERHGVSRCKLQNFLAMVQRNYHASNPYHNFEHGVMVMHMAVMIMSETKRCSVLSSLEILAIKIAALCHDIDHPGWNNDFEVNTGSTRALLYNDVSVLENHHASFLFGQLRRQEQNILENLNPRAFKDLRKMVVGAILATDMSQHEALVERLHVVCDSVASQPDFFKASKNNRQFLADSIIHLGDMSNQAADDWEVAKNWGFRVIAEFKSQALKEEQQGIPVSPFFNDLSTDSVIATKQIAFADYVVAPLISAALDLFPELDHMATNLKRNRDLWAQFAVESAEAEQSAEDNNKRLR